MKVFVTGASGFIGSAIVRELLDGGHEVLGLARSDARSDAIRAAGAGVHRGALNDLDSVRAGAAASDGVIHTAFIHDFSDFAENGRTDNRAVEAIGAALEGSDRPFVITSGTAALTAGRIGKENDEPNRNSPGVHRIASEDIVRGLRARGVRGSIVRLPPTVHGDNDHGFVPRLIDIAREKGVSAYVGDGNNRWPAVHRLDAAHLFCLALQQGEAGASYHGVAEEGVPTRTIATVIGRRLNLPVVSKSPDEVAEHFGWLGHFFALDCPASSELTRSALGWTATHVGLIDDLENGTYFSNIET